MIVDTVTEAKAQLSSLIELVLQGEEVIISRAGKPVACLVAYDPKRRPRKPGALKGHIHIKQDFDELPDDIAGPFGMGES
jgi:prevent-host-death family protein